MKKILILILVAFAANYVKAQKLNQDTLAKYSKKEEQLKVFSRIAKDIHLDATQSEKFSQLSEVYSNKAIAIVKESKAAPCEKLGSLKQTLKEYLIQIKQVLSPEQLAVLKGEREKYHFGRRFVTFND